MKHKLFIISDVLILVMRINVMLKNDTTKKYT